MLHIVFMRDHWLGMACYRFGYLGCGVQYPMVLCFFLCGRLQGLSLRNMLLEAGSCTLTKTLYVLKWVRVMLHISSPFRRPQWIFYLLGLKLLYGLTYRLAQRTNFYPAALTYFAYPAIDALDDYYWLTTREKKNTLPINIKRCGGCTDLQSNRQHHHTTNPS